MNEYCAFCKKVIEQHQYRHKFELLLPDEQHGDNLTIAARPIELQVHPECSMELGQSLYVEGDLLLEPSKMREQFTNSLAGFLDTRGLQ